MDRFDYRVHDGVLSSNTVTATLTVFAQNDTPVAQDDLYQVPQDQALNIVLAQGLLSNDSDVDADVLQVELVDALVHGQAQVATDGSFSYQPLPGFSGTDEFRYAASDGLARALAQVRITVSAPGNQAPVAEDETYTTAEDTLLSGVLTANDSDPDGDALQVLVVEAPEHGTLSLNGGVFEYRPAQDYAGPDRINYRVSDGALQSAMVTAQITVTPVNDPPLAQTDHYLLIQNQTLTVAAGDGVLANDSDVEAEALTAMPEQAPGHGTVQLQADGAFVYQPHATYSGRDEFSYRASDGQGSSSGRVIIDITQAPNQRPVAIGEAFLLPEDTVLDTRELESLLANDYDPEAQPLTLELLGAPATGVLQDFADGHVRYAPQRDFHGEVRIDYTVSDGELTALPVQASIVYTPLNDPPVAQPDLYHLPAAQPSLQIAGVHGVLANDRDADGDTLVTTLVRAPMAGSLNLGLDGSFLYTPVVPRAPADSFRYRISDPTGLSNEAEVDLSMDDTQLPDPIFSSGFESPSP